MGLAWLGGCSGTFFHKPQQYRMIERWRPHVVMVEPQIIENGYYPYPFTAKCPPSMELDGCPPSLLPYAKAIRQALNKILNHNTIFLYVSTAYSKQLNHWTGNRIRHVCAVLLQGTHVQKQGNKTLKKPTAASMLGSIVSLAFLSYFGISFVWGITQPYLIKNKTKFLRTERLPFHHKCKMKK